MSTNKKEWNIRHNQKSNKSNSKTDIAKKSGVPKKVLDKVFDRGIGAYKTNPESVRKNVKSKEQWAYARVYSFVNKLEGNRKLNHDKDLVKQIPKYKNKDISKL